MPLSPPDPRPSTGWVWAGVAALIGCCFGCATEPAHAPPVLSQEIVDTAKALMREQLAGHPLPLTITNSIGMPMRLVRPGTFLMGDPTYAPAHRVTLTQPFYLGIYEVNQPEWASVMGGSSGFPRLVVKGDKQVTIVRTPTEAVCGFTWEQCARYCRLLSDREGVEYRLPTEAEWEYACRAGTTTRYSWGDAWDANAALRPNPWGLFFMHTGATEWCGDWHAPYSAEDTTDPRGPMTGTLRILRGGEVGCDLDFCLSTTRFGQSPAQTWGHHIGFRLVLPVKDETPTR